MQRREERRERKRERRMAFVNGMEGGEGQFSEASFTAAADRTGEKKLGGRKRVLGPKRDAEGHGGGKEKREGRLI